MKEFLSCIKDKYVCFSGRARRREYWMFYLFYMIFYIASAVVGGIILLVFMCLDSQPGENRFGPNPKGL